MLRMPLLRRSSTSEVLESVVRAVGRWYGGARRGIDRGRYVSCRVIVPAEDGARQYAGWPSQHVGVERFGQQAAAVFQDGAVAI